MKRALTVVLLTPWLTFSIGAQPAAEEAPEDLTAEVAKINSSLAELVELMRQQVEGQTLDLLMRRIQLSAERVSLVERDLRTSRRDRQSVVDEKVQLEDRKEMFEDQMERGHLVEAEMEAFTSQIDNSLERLEQRLQSADREIAELEATLGRQRQDLREWQELVDAKLERL